MIENTVDELLKTILEEHVARLASRDDDDTKEKKPDLEGGETNKPPWDLYGVLADMFEEEGELGKASKVRWLRFNKRRPYISELPAASWFSTNYHEEKDDPYSNLPVELYDKLTKGKVTANHHTYPSFKEALMDFLES